MGRRKSTSPPVTCITIVIGEQKFSVKLDKREKIKDRRQLSNALDGIRSAMFHHEVNSASSECSSPEEPILYKEEKPINPVLISPDLNEDSIQDIDLRFFSFMQEEDCSYLFGL